MYASDLLPWLCSLPAVGGLPPEVEKKLWEGAMTSSGKLFEGNLGNGLLAFHAAMREKVTYQFQSRDSFRRRCLAGGTLRLPGIAVIGESETLQLPAIQKVADGGILLHSGEIRVTGDITRGGTGEPLTLVSLQKDIVIGPGVGRIEAQLIALDGSVRFGSTNDVVIEGGVSTRTLALEDLRDRPAHRVVRYAPELDPLGPTRATAVRVFFGGKAGKPLISVSGGG
ncbi:MAG: hypothetical protein HY815_03985 [Candidatus Riflebacteria bacterium]|nr:hypothetical protein [Candidatus Riflebacteria bacterium]